MAIIVTWCSKYELEQLNSLGLEAATQNEPQSALPYRFSEIFSIWTQCYILSKTGRIRSSFAMLLVLLRINTPHHTLIIKHRILKTEILFYFEILISDFHTHVYGQTIFSFTRTVACGFLCSRNPPSNISKDPELPSMMIKFSCVPIIKVECTSNFQFLCGWAACED